MKKNVFLSYVMVVAMIFLFDMSSFAADRLESIKTRGYVNISTNAEFEPFEYKEGEEFVGIDMEIAREIAKKLEVDIVINDVSFGALPLEIGMGNCDFIIASMSCTEEKSQNMNFSIPYFNAKQSIIVSGESDIASSSDLHNKSIGVHLGTTGDIYCTSNFPDSNVCKYNNGPEAMLDLINGRIDAIVIDEFPAIKLVEKNASCKILEESLFTEEYRVAVPKGEPELLEFINTSITELQKDGTLDRITDKYRNKGYEKKENGILGQMYNNLIYKDRYKDILQGLKITLEITVVSLLIGLSIGVCVSLIKIIENKNMLIKIMKILANTYIAVIRGTPVVVQMFIMYYLILSSSGLPKIVVAMIAFGVNSGAYVSEIIRAGIMAVDRGQFEAGRALGLTEITVMSKIILPQAFKNIVPTLCNEFISLLKETSVSGFIGIVDLSRTGDIIRSQTYEPFVPLVTTALIYFSIVCMIFIFMNALERRLRKNDIG